MKFVIFVSVLLAILATSTQVHARNLRSNSAHSEHTLSRSKRGSTADLTITDKAVETIEKGRRSKLIQKLLNETASTNPSRDCASCFGPQAKKYCVCEVTDILRHIQKGRKEGKGLQIKQLRQLPLPLRQRVQVKLREIVAKQIRNFREQYKNRNPRRYMLGLIRRNKQYSRSVFKNSRMIIF